MNATTAAGPVGKILTQNLATLLETLTVVSEIASRETLQLQTLTIFLVVAMRGEVSQVELNKLASVSEAAVSRNIRLLGRGRPDSPGYGWVDAQRDPYDNRFITVRLTKEGAKVARAISDHLGGRK